MKVKPVIYSMKPKYPDKYSIDINELMYYKPHRWMNKPLVISALSATILLSSCANELGITGSSDTTTLVTSKITTLETSGTSNAMSFNIPIFFHGKGTGVIGCEVVNAPLFLTEEEAFAVISEELKLAGIEAIKNDKASSEVEVPVTNAYYEPGKEENKIVTSPQDFTYDAYTKIGTKYINIEFVSNDDYKNWENKNQGVWSSVEYLNLKGAAEALAKENNSVAAFYDPFTYYNYMETNVEMENTYDDEKEAHNASLEFLRSQVKDFMEWLKAEGVI